MNKREFTTIEKGTTYALNKWKVVEGQGIVLTGNFETINFVRGSKLKEEDVTPNEGILHETLLSMMIEDLKFKNTLVPSREGSTAITKLQEALHWMEERQYQRTKENTVGTYKK